MSYPIPLILVDVLDKSDTNFSQLASTFIGSLKTILQKESAVISHDSVIEYSEGLSWVVRCLSDDTIQPIGNSIIKDVIVPYLTTVSSEVVHQPPPSLKAIAKLFAELLCHRTIGVELVENVLVPIVSALGTYEPVQLLAKFKDTNVIQGEHLNPWLVLTLQQAIFQPRVTALLEAQVGGGKAMAALFSHSLQLFKSLPAVCCQLLASSVLPLYISPESAHHSVEQLWTLVETVREGRVPVVCGKTEIIQTILCCFSDLLIGKDSRSPFASVFQTSLLCALPVRDVRKEEVFHSIVQEGLVSSEPLERKRSRYLVHRMTTSMDGIGKLASPEWTFWWDKEHDSALRTIWADVLLLLETLEEKTVHIVLPVLNRVKSLSAAVNTDIGGHSMLQHSWLEALFTRVIDHESKSVMKWGVNEFLNMHILSCSSSPKHWQFILGPLLGALSKSVLYERDASEHFNGCPAVVTHLSAFLSCFVAELPKDHQGPFIHQFLSACWTLKLVDVPLVYVSYSLSLLPSMPVLDSTSLLVIRSLVQGSLHTIKVGLRGPIQNFLLTAVCSLTDMAFVSYSDIFMTLGCFSISECLVYGSHAWHQATCYVRDYCRTNTAALCPYLHGAIQETLKECPAPSTPTPSQTALAFLLALSCHDSILIPSGHTLEEFLARTLGPVLDTIVSASNRPYLSCHVVTRAVEVMVGVLELLVMGTQLGKVDTLLYKYMLPWLPGLLTHCEHELLQGAQNRIQPDLGHTLLYKRAMDRIYTFGCNFSVPVSVHSLMDQAFDVLQGSGQSTELTAPFLGAVTAMSWVTSRCKGTVDRQFLGFPLAVKLKRPAGCASWEVQPDWSALFHHSLTCYWECVLYVLQRRCGVDGGGGDGDGDGGTWEDVAAVNDLAHACMSSVDLIGRGGLHVLISCMALLAPKLDPDMLCSHVDTLWTLLIQYKTTPHFTAALSSFISLCFNITFDTLKAPSIFAMQAKYIGELTVLGQGKSRAYMLLVDHLCTTWLGLLKSNPDLLFPSLHQYTSVVLDACCFGPIYRKNLRLFEDALLFTTSLEDMCTTNQLEMSQHMSKDCYVRVKIISFLVHVASLDRPDGSKYLNSLLVSMADKLLQLSIENPKYYTNTSIHRVKLRLAQAMLVLIQWIDRPSSGNVINVLLKCLRYDNQVSVRYLMEWMAALIFSRYPDLLEQVFYPCLQQDSDIRSSRMSSIFTVALHVSRNLPSVQYKVSFYGHVMLALYLWCSNHNCTVRLYAHQLLILLWEETKGEVPDRYPMLGEVVSHIKNSSDHIKALRKLQDNVFFSHLNIIEDLNIQVIFQVLPQLTGVIQEEWLHVLKMFKEHGDVWKKGGERGVAPIPLDSSNQVLLDQTETVCGDYGEESHQQSCDGDDVQRKISLLNGVGVMGELFPSLPLSLGHQGEVNSGLILVMSLVQKIPNLGGLCRTCEVFGVSELIVDNLSILQDREFQSLSVTAEKWLVISEVKVHSIPKYLADKRQDGYTIAGLEQTAESCAITEYQFKYKTVLVLGNEHHGIPVEVLHLMDQCLEAPQFGVIRSLNVHVAGAIAIWEYTKQHLVHH